MGKNSGNHVIKDNTICDIRVYHSGEGTGTRRLRGREMRLNACRSPKVEGRRGGGVVGSQATGLIEGFFGV